MELKFSKVERKGPITIVTLTRPEVYNALHIDAHFELPPGDSGLKQTQVRLRAPRGNTIHSVTLNGKPWARFDPQTETITLPAQQRPQQDLVIGYR